MNFKKSLFISFCLHAFLLGLTIKFYNNTMPLPQHQNNPVEVTIVTKGEPKKQKEIHDKLEEEVNKLDAINKGGEGRTIMPTSIFGTKIKSKGQGYFGIGVVIDAFPDESRVHYNGRDYAGIRLTRVVEGYPAYMHNLQANDIVIMVDGMPATTDNITGVDKTPVNLVINRGNSFFEVTIERDFIYYEQSH